MNEYGMEISGGRRKQEMMFSFPVITWDELESGLGCPNSPADQLFSNGKLLPHTFPIQTAGNSAAAAYSRSSSRRSKDSLMSSSRSNSSGSGRSSTSTEAAGAGSSYAVNGGGMRGNVNGVLSSNHHHHHHHYYRSSTSQLLGGAPLLMLRRSQGSTSRISRKLKYDDTKTPSATNNKSSWFGKRLFKSFVSTCKQCHAINT